MYKDLDPILHSQLRLAVVSILASVEKADFAYLKTETGATSGNLSVQITKLKIDDDEYFVMELIINVEHNYVSYSIFIGISVVSLIGLIGVIVKIRKVINNRK